MNRTLTPIRKVLSFQVILLLAVVLLLPFSATAQLRLNQSPKQENKPLTQAAAPARQAAEVPTKQDPRAENASPFDAVKGKKEDISKRDAFSKHYKNDDGSYTALIGAGPIHYEKNGSFYDIDHNITASGDANYPYANTTNLFESYFGATAHKGVKNRTPEGEITEFLNTKMYWEVNGQAVNTLASANTAVTIQADKAYYNNLYGSIAAEFTVESGRRKLNYIIPNAQALGNIPAGTDYLTFTEDVVLPQGWTHTVSENGILIKNQAGKQIYLYENPVSTDASDNLEAEQNTIFETSLNGNVLTIKTKVKTTWLLDNARQFPVKVDPTVNTWGNSTASVNWNGFFVNFPNQNRDVISGINAGYLINGYVKYNVSSITSGSTINTATSYTKILSNSTYSTNGHLWASCNLDVTTASGSDLWNDNDEGGTSTVYWSAVPYASSAAPANSIRTQTLNANAINDIQSALAQGWFAMRLQIAGNDWSLSYGERIQIWGERGNTTTGGTNNHRPYLSINYTEPVGPPTCATLIGPANGATAVAHQGQLSWNAVGGATSYDVYFGATASPPLVSTSQTGTTYTIGGCLLPNTQYYWRVVPKNANGSATGCTTWNFTTDGKLNIYKNDWETASPGVFSTSGAGVDGWLTNNNSATGGAWNNGYNNAWTVGNTGTNVISGTSVGISALLNGGLGGAYFQYWNDLGEIHRWIYRPFDMRGLRDIEVSFRWKCGGEANQDYGSVISSINGGANWLMDEQGGLNNDGRYWNSQTTIQSQTIVFPNTRNNQQDFVLGFKWDDMSGNWNGVGPSFVVDDIVIKACPYEGNINSNVVGAGIYEWIPTASTQATLTINGSHACAQYQWEQSTDDGVTWANVTGGSGATTVSYTTPSNLTITTLYRCKVYFGTGCTGVYQANSFAINLIPACDAEITSVTPDNDEICGDTHASITAVANDSNHEIRWYAASSGGSPLYTGDTFETPNLTTTTTYYVAAYDSNEDCESARTAVAITVNQIPANVNVSIGTPANGTNHHINVSWDAISGAWQYQIDYSWDNNTWSTGGFSTSTSHSLNLFDNPDREVFIRVKRYDNGGLPNCYAYASPIHTAADNPGELTFGTVTGTSVQVIIPAETPVANPAHTTYSIFNETLGLYVQADGSLGATEVFQTKTEWNSTPVIGLQPETEYCFYAKAKNQDDDIRFEQATQVMATQEFNSNPPLTTNSGNNNWYAPSSNPPFTWTASGNGCPDGAIGYSGSWNNFWGNFVRLPLQNMTGMDNFTLKFDLSNSYTAGRTESDITFSIWADNNYRNIISEVKVNGAPVTLTSNGRIKFDELRQCAAVEVTFDLNHLNYDVIDHSSIFIYINASSSYNNSDPFFFYIDNISILEGDGTGLSACITTGSACEAEITSVTGGSGCGSIALSAETNDDNIYVVNWYDAATNGNLIHTGFTYNANVGSTTSYWVSASNGTCESSPRTEVIATVTPTDAEIVYTEGASACNPGNVTLYAETNDDDTYEVNWYDENDQLLHTGFSYTVYLSQTTTFYVAAAEGDCESAKEEVTATINSKTWNGSVSSNWNIAANWTPAGVPSSQHCVVIPDVANAPVITSGNEGFAKSLTLLEGASLLVESESSITVTENVVLATNAVTGETLADLTLENDGYLVQTNNTPTNNNVGKITVNRHSTPMFRLEATGWSSPVENQKLYDFAIGTVFGRIYWYNEVSNGFVNTGITQSSEFVPGQGYSVRAPNGYPTYVDGMNRTNDAEIFEGVFYGRPNNGDIGINVTADYLGYNYVGNPYPSPIDAEEFLIANEDYIETLYFWTHEAPPILGVYAANNYAYFNISGGTASAAGGEEPDGIINVGQGFIVQTNNSFQLDFTNDLRISYSDRQFFRAAQLERHRMWLNLSDSETAYNQILVGYIQNATMGVDHQIDGKMFGHSGSAIYSLIENNKFVIQGRSLPFDITDSVPLGFKAATAGMFNINIGKTDGLFAEGQIIYLEDMALNTVHNLSEGAYNFLSETGTFESRFRIIYENNPLSANNPDLGNSDWIAYNSNNQITVQSIGFDIESVEVYDLTGRLLIKKQDINAQTFAHPAHFADQVLVVKVNGTMVKKINYNN